MDCPGLELFSFVGDEAIAAVRQAAAQASLPLRERALSWLVGETPPPGTRGVVINAGELDATIVLALSTVRRSTDAALILLTDSAHVEQRILARTVGVDHVLAKPIDPRELAALFGNLMRGHDKPLGRPRAGEHDMKWYLSAERWTLVAPNGRDIRLSAAEYELMHTLLERPGQIFQRSDLGTAPADARGGQGSRSLDVLISKLRRKVFDIAGVSLPLRSARNAGYVFAGAVRGADEPG